MNFLKRSLYGAFVGSLRTYRAAFLDLCVHGRDRIPPGPKIFVTNHITSTDPFWVLPEFGEFVHIIIGPGYQSRWAEWLLDRFEQINAMPGHRKSVVDKAVDYLQKGESVYTAPEGDIQDGFELGHFYTGVARIYRRTLAPIIPIALVAPRESRKAHPRWDLHVGDRTYRAVYVLRGPYSIRIGQPFRPDCGGVENNAENGRITAELRARMAALVEATRVERGWS